MGVLNALPDNSFISIAYLNGVPQCGSIIFYSKNMAYYMYGASANGAHNGAGCLLQWENMLYLKKLDVQKYSFVGYRFNVDDNSKLQNIQRFKERFGGEVDRGFMFKCIMRPRKRRLFEILCKIKGIKEFDAIDQEIHKWGDKPSVNNSEV